MLLCRRILSVCLAVLMIAPFASAQEHVIGRAALDKMIQDRLNREQADRDVILSLLERPDVRNIAASAGLSIARAQTAVAMLHGTTLQQAAEQARQAQDDLAGGASTVTISTTTIIIVLLLIILIVLIAK
jgi:Family of unknown function (DUF6627)